MHKLEERIVDFANYLADEARNALLPFYRKQFSVEDKQDQSPVTEVDRAVEGVIRKLIENNYPEHGIFGEEYGVEREGSEYTWVIDPIDGTKSFISGRPIFGTLISLVHEKTPVLGIIDQPVNRERWIGANGQTLFNGQEIKVRECANIESAYFGTTSPFLFNQVDLSAIQKISDNAKCTLYGGDCYLYGQLASGFLDVVVESGLKPYDFCALVPVVENAGGKITDWAGNAITMDSKGKILACGDARVHQKLEDWLV